MCFADLITNMIHQYFVNRVALVQRFNSHSWRSFCCNPLCEPSCAGAEVLLPLKALILLQSQWAMDSLYITESFLMGITT